MSEEHNLASGSLTAPPSTPGSSATAEGPPPASSSGKSPVSPREPAFRRGGGLALLLAVASLVAVALLGWQWFEIRGRIEAMHQELAQRLAEGDTLAKEARGVARQGQETLAALQAKVGAVEGRLADSEGQAAALETLYQEFSRSRDDRTLAEVEQAVMLASQQLQLAGNVEAALIALEGAESRLALIDQTRFQPLRRALASDVEQLRALPSLDVTGMSIKLELLQATVDSLPLAFAGEAQAKAPPEASGEGGPANFLTDLGRELWRELRGLVRVERLDRAEPALLGPAQGAYLRENLKIRLLSARLGLLSRDGRAFSEDLRQAASWVERYFDLHQQAVQTALKDMQELAAVKISQDRPAIKDSLVALRALQSRPPAAAAAPAGSAAKPAAR
jgi:uroporphyrin-3 C-methyltransferase